MNKIRCAIYTRKSSEEGLEQDFNSLDAQREACEAYIISQKHEGWVILPEHYDDGGISGGTLERPALLKLMQNVEEGLVDQIVVYKIDRLTRSLADFAKLVDKLEKAEASFVSVTQSFNTATNMGRLTLNVLLSFAQFEREVTAERIRDKIAASKQKGMWMGGTIPIGYSSQGRTLVIEESEAKTIRKIYDLYLDLGTVREVTEKARGLGLRSKPKSNSQCKLLGRGHIHYILTNPLYAGSIRHKDKVHEGLHPAIIEPEQWELVQERLLLGAARKRGVSKNPSNTSSLLAGKLFDEDGDRLTPSHANKQGKHYHYYVSNRLISKSCEKDAPKNKTNNVSSGWRLPAKKLEMQLAKCVHQYLKQAISDGLLIDVGVETLGETMARMQNLQSSVEDNELLLNCIQRFDVGQGKGVITLNQEGVAELLGTKTQQINYEMLTFEIPFQLRKRGVESKIILGEPEASMDPILIRNIAKANNWYGQLKKGMSIPELAALANISTRRLQQLLKLAFLSPEIVKSILQGNQPIGLTTDWLTRRTLPLSWDDQRELISRL